MNSTMDIREQNLAELVRIVTAMERPDIDPATAEPDEDLHEFTARAEALAQAGTIGRGVLEPLAATAATAVHRLASEDDPPSPAGMAALSVLAKLVLLVDGFKAHRHRASL